MYYYSNNLNESKSNDSTKTSTVVIHSDKHVTKSEIDMFVEYGLSKSDYELLKGLTENFTIYGGCGLLGTTHDELKPYEKYLKKYYKGVNIHQNSQYYSLSFSGLINTDNLNYRKWEYRLSCYTNNFTDQQNFVRFGNHPSMNDKRVVMDILKQHYQYVSIDIDSYGTVIKFHTQKTI